jgi:hypothetical protein
MPLALGRWGRRDVNTFRENRRVLRPGIQKMGKYARWGNFPHLATDQEKRRVLYRVWTLFRIKLRHMIRTVARRNGEVLAPIQIGVGAHELKRRRVQDILKRGY